MTHSSTSLSQGATAKELVETAERIFWEKGVYKSNDTGATRYGIARPEDDVRVSELPEGMQADVVLFHIQQMEGQAIKQLWIALNGSVEYTEIKKVDTSNPIRFDRKTFYDVLSMVKMTFGQPHKRRTKETE